MLGLDMGSHTVKVVKVSQSDGPDRRLDFWGHVEKEGLKQFLEKNHLLGLPTAACINDPSLKIRKIELPDMPPSDMKEAVRWKMRDIVDGPIAEFAVSSSIVETTAVGEIKKQVLIGYALKRSVVTELTNLILQLGLKPKMVEPTAVSLAACIEKIYPSENHWMAGLDIGQSQTIMNIIGHGKFYFSRPLPGISLEEAKLAPDSFMKKLAGEIQNTLDTFSVTFQVEKINRIFLAGGGAGVQGLSEYLSKNLAVESSIINPFQGLDNSLLLEKNEEQKLYLYAQAVSLACS